MQIRLANGDFIEVFSVQGGATSTASAASTDTNYSTRLIKDPATGQTIAETRTLSGVTERQTWIYDTTGAYIGVDAWVTV